MVRPSSCIQSVSGVDTGVSTDSYFPLHHRYRRSTAGAAIVPRTRAAHRSILPGTSPATASCPPPGGASSDTSERRAVGPWLRGTTARTAPAGGRNKGYCIMDCCCTCECVIYNWLSQSAEYKYSTIILFFSFC